MSNHRTRTLETLRQHPEVMPRLKLATAALVKLDQFLTSNHDRLYPLPSLQRLSQELTQAAGAERDSLCERIAQLSNPGSVIIAENLKGEATGLWWAARVELVGLANAALGILTMFKRQAIGQEREFLAAHGVEYAPTNLSRQYDALMAEFTAKREAFSTEVAGSPIGNPRAALNWIGIHDITAA